jgi:uncharacterized protein with HEPN domain
MSKSEIEFIKHIYDEVVFVISFTSSISYEDFENEILLKKAIVRSLEIIGEASNRVTSDFKSKYQEIPWRFMKAMRNKLIHEYVGIDYKVVYETCKNDIPILKEQLESILST